ncbi:MAG: hypothetical protein ACRD4X_16915 [Candidatus Acidiferrales bacterium]
MRVKFFVICAAGCMALALSGGRFVPKAYAAGPVPADCNRACLENLANEYLNALVAHDPKQLPLAADVRYTENDQPMEVGDGFWGTVTAVGHFRLCFSDVVMQQIGCMVTMHEGSNLLLMGMRLRVQLGRITEIETSYYRQGGGGPSGIAALDASTPDPIWSQTVPESQRVSRASMIATANKYFASLENDSGKGDYSFFADDCNRTENGMQTTNNPSISPKAEFNAFALGCKAQFASGYYAVVTRIWQRRFPIVDQQRGVVWANVTFDQNGTVHTIKLTNGQTVTMPGIFNKPSSIQVTECFKIRNGQIHRIEMVGSGLPYHLNSPWGGISDK